MNHVEWGGGGGGSDLFLVIRPGFMCLAECSLVTRGLERWWEWEGGSDIFGYWTSFGVSHRMLVTSSERGGGEGGDLI